MSIFSRILDFFSPYDTYTVVKGDTLSGIAARYPSTVTWQRIYEVNPYITNPNKIYPGMVLRIPKI